MRQLVLTMAEGEGDAVDVRLDTSAWRALNAYGREDLTRPRGDAVVRWVERGETMEARVAPAVAETLRGMCEALNVELREGDARVAA